MEYIKLACLKCGQGNRVPNDKLYQGPKCAHCSVGLMSSKVTELSPKKYVAFLMGVWFLASFYGHFFAGKIDRADF